MYCTFCNSENEEGSKFCQECGRAFIDIAEEDTTRVPGDVVAERRRYVNPLNVGIILVFGVALLLAVISYAAAPFATAREITKHSNNVAGDMFFLMSALTSSIIAMVACIVGAIFSAFAFARLRKLISELDAPTHIANKLAGFVMIFSIVACGCLLVCAINGMSVISSIDMHNSMQETTIKAPYAAAVWLLVLSLLSIAPAIFTLISAIRLKTKIRKII